MRSSSCHHKGGPEHAGFFFAIALAATPKGTYFLTAATDRQIPMRTMLRVALLPAIFVRHPTWHKADSCRTHQIIRRWMVESSVDMR
jgi:hypothetical protein